MVRKDAWNDLNFFELPRLYLWPRIWSVLEKVLCALEKKVKLIVLGWNVLQISIRSNWSIVSFKICVSLLIFCLVDLSVGVSGVLKSPTYCVIVNFPLILVSTCLTYCGASMLLLLLVSRFSCVRLCVTL